jgi:hypothetical protein
MDDEFVRSDDDGCSSSDERTIALPSIEGSQRMKSATSFLLLGIALLAMSASCFYQAAQKASGWDAWEFLLGEWIGEGGGDPGQGTGRFTFSFDLQKTLLVRKNHVDYPPTNDRPAFAHDDLTVVYREGGGQIRAIYFDNEGHVINYAVEFSKDSSSIIFTSDLNPSAPRFRATYTKAANGTVGTAFEIAPPGKPEAFSLHVKGAARRKN